MASGSLLRAVIQRDHFEVGLCKELAYLLEEYSSQQGHFP